MTVHWAGSIQVDGALVGGGGGGVFKGCIVILTTMLIGYNE